MKEKQYINNKKNKYCKLKKILIIFSFCNKNLIHYIYNILYIKYNI